MPSPSPAARTPGLGAVRDGLPPASPGWIRRAKPLLGTVVTISVADRRCEQTLHAAIDLAFWSMERIHDLMSLQNPDSDLARLNRDAARGPQRVDAHTYAVFETAVRIAHLSRGAFDPCVAPRLEKWGLLPPTGAACDPAGNWRALELLPGGRIRYSTSVRVDLGGIAKGYAVDAAVRSLKAEGFEHIVVNAGGDLRVAGADEHTVHLRDPSRPWRAQHEVGLRNAALATSAAYFSRRLRSDGCVSALVNPRAGTAYLGANSISVRAAECMLADALTKVVLFAPREIAEAALEKFDAQAFVIQRDRRPRDR